MGLRDLFSRGGGGGGKGKGRLAKHIKTTTNPYTQSADRYASMEALLDIAASDDDSMTEAYVGLLKRFTISSTKSIEDEEEKGWVCRRLIAVGKPVLPAIRSFCLEAESIAWALRILEEVANEAEEWDVLDALIEAHPPGYERSSSKKQQLLAHLHDIDDPSVAVTLARYLEDTDEGIRFQVVESLVDIGDERSLEPLVDRLVNPEEDSIRLRTRILDGLAELEWSVAARRDEIAKHLGHEHKFAGEKIKRV